MSFPFGREAEARDTKKAPPSATAPIASVARSPVASAPAIPAQTAAPTVMRTAAGGAPDPLFVEKLVPGIA